MASSKIHQYNNFINGQWSASDSYVPIINPSNFNEIVGEYAQADVTQVNMAVSAARSAFSEWQSGNLQIRAEALDKIGAELLLRRSELGTLLAREEGKTLIEGVGEVIRAGNIFRFFAGECFRLVGELLPSVRSGVGVEVTREPVGVVALITPWNFPMAIPAWKVAPALAYGNCVVLKPADLVPGSAWALAEIISRSGLPEGVFNLVMGPGRIVGDHLVNHAGIDAISFTGSAGVGASIATACAASMKKVQLEMGGKNPQVVLDDADLNQAVELCVQSAFFSTGQRCTAASRLIVTAGIYPAFIEAMKARMASLRIDDAMKPETDIGPVASQSQLAKDLSYVEIGRAEGAELVFGGERLQREYPGNYFAPTLFVDSQPFMRINREEIFGPIASVIRVSSYDEALAVANDIPFGLSAGIATSSLKHASHFKRFAQAGMVMVNLPTAGVDYHVPFGGRKASSHGSREQGRYAQEFYTTVKTAYTMA